MFFCIGQNDFALTAIGSGNTLLDAVISWANVQAGCKLNEGQCYKYFSDYEPDIISGEKIEYTVKEIITYEIATY